MKKYLITDEKLTDIGDAIREKTGKTDLIPVEQMDEEIRSIQVGVDTSDATAAPGELLVGKTAYVNEQKITGTMVDNGAVSQNLNAGGSYTIPAGYHNGQGKVNANSLASQTSGTAEAGEILKGETAWVNGSQVTGTMENRGAVSQALNAGGSYTVPAGYHNGSGKVTANSLASQTSANAAAANIESGYTAWVNGVKVTGSLVPMSLSGTSANTYVPKNSTAITKGNFVSSIPTHTVYKQTLTTTGSANNNFTNTLYIDSTRMLVSYCGLVSLLVKSGNSWSITSTVTTTSKGYVSMAKLTDTSIIIAYGYNGYAYSAIITLSGNSLTLGTAQRFMSTGTYNGCESYPIEVVAHNSTVAFLSYAYRGGMINFGHGAAILSINGTSVSLLQDAGYYTTDNIYHRSYASCIKMSDTDYLVNATSANSSGDPEQPILLHYTVTNNNTITRIGGPTWMGGNYGWLSFYKLSTTKCLCFTVYQKTLTWGIIELTSSGCSLKNFGTVTLPDRCGPRPQVIEKNGSILLVVRNSNNLYVSKLTIDSTNNSVTFGDFVIHSQYYTSYSDNTLGNIEVSNQTMVYTPSTTSMEIYDLELDGFFYTNWVQPYSGTVFGVANENGALGSTCEIVCPA